MHKRNKEVANRVRFELIYADPQFDVGKKCANLRREVCEQLVMSSGEEEKKAFMVTNQIYFFETTQGVTI